MNPMSHTQLLEQYLSHSLQMHLVKDKQIEDLQIQVTQLKKKYEPQPEAPAAQ